MSLIEVKPELKRQRQSLKDRWDEQLWTSACFRDYQLACVQKAFDAEVEQIEKEYESERANIRGKLLTDLMEHRRRLTENRGANDEQQDNNNNSHNPQAQAQVQTTSNNSNRNVQRKLRGKRSGEGVMEQKSLPSGKKRQPQGGIEDKA